MSANRTVVFSCLAAREVEFFSESAKQFVASGEAGAARFISFYEPGDNDLQKAGWPVVRFYDELDRTPARDLDETIKYFAIKDRAEFDHLLTHEFLTFGLKDREALKEKFIRYLWTADRVLQDIIESEKGREVVVCEELGGFVACFAVFYAARRLKLQHVFFEPSFFKGRVLAVWNSLSTRRPKSDFAGKILDVCRDYLKNTREKRTMVIPKKDQHHFVDMTVKKIVNSRNMRQLSAKIVNKYARGKRFEFNHIANHTTRSLRMFMNRKRRTSLYDPKLENAGKGFVYFPLHVELDYALTVRSPLYLDQVALLKEIATSLPPGVKLVAKEHPASVGGFDHKRLVDLVKNQKNFVFLHPSINTYAILEKAGCVVTINSKVGAEALLMAKTVLVLGDSFYASSEIVRPVKNRAELPAMIADVLKSEPVVPIDKIERFFASVWEDSFEGELYVMNAENIRRFTQGLAKEIKSVVPPAAQSNTSRDEARV
jgi:hypothetical protein